MKTAKLGDHVEILSGFAFKSEFFNDESRGLPLVRIRDVKPAQSNTYYAGEYDNRFLLSNGDLLVGMDGEFNCARWNGGRALLNQRVCRIRVKSTLLDEQYLFWFLPKVLKEIENKSNFVTVKHLSSKQINEIAIPLPPINEQKRIAAILDQADELRRKRQRAIDRLNQLGQAIFCEMFGHMHDTPSGWPVVQFCELVENSKIGIVRSSREMGEEFNVPYVRMDSIQRDGRFDVSNLKKTHATKSERETFNLMPGDFLFNTRNSKELVGKTAIVSSKIDAIYNNNILRVRFNGKVNSRFVHTYFWQPFAQRELEARKSGTTSVFAIYQKSLDTMPVPLPPPHLQEVFSDRIKLIEMSRDNFERALFEQNHLFLSLQHRAFQGEL